MRSSDSPRKFATGVGGRLAIWNTTVYIYSCWWAMGSLEYVRMAKMAMDENKKRALAAALGQIERQFGKGAVMRMGDHERQSIPAISTGSISATGVNAPVFPT